MKKYSAVGVPLASCSVSEQNSCLSDGKCCSPGQVPFSVFMLPVFLIPVFILCKNPSSLVELICCSRTVFTYIISSLEMKITLGTIC